MKIMHKTRKPVMLNTIPQGAVFMSESGSYFIKTEVITDHYGNKCEAINLENGIAVLTDEGTLVYVIDCTLVCE